MTFSVRPRVAQLLHENRKAFFVKAGDATKRDKRTSCISTISGINRA